MKSKKPESQKLNTIPAVFFIDIDFSSVVIGLIDSAGMTALGKKRTITSISLKHNR